MTTNEIAERVDSFADVFAEDYTDVVEKVENEKLELGIRSILEALESVKVDGKTVFDGSTVKLDGVKALISALPRPSEIAGWDKEDVYNVVL